MREEDKPVFYALSDLEAMALTIYGEARGAMGRMLGVGFVIVNRSRLWKQSIKKVCYAKNQFSCYLSTDWNYEILNNIAKDLNANLTNNKHLQLCLQCAEMVYCSQNESNVGDATFYRVKGNKNKWFDNAFKEGKLKEVCQIGAHIFYKEALC